MKINSLLLLFGLLLSLPLAAQKQSESFRENPPKPGPAPKIELGDYEQFKLSNGLTVIVVENHKLPRVSFQLLVDLPPLYEGEYAGAASMAGSLLSTGTKSRTKAQIDEAVDFIGASFSSSASGLFGAALTKHKEQLLEIMSDVLRHPTFPEDEFSKLKTQTLSGLASNKDNPETIAANVAQVLRYGKDHPYGELTTETTVENITVDKCREFYRQYFKPNISYLAIVGDITPAEARSLAESYFGDWATGTVVKKDYPKPQPPASTQVDFVNKAGAVQSVVNITHPVDLQPGHPDAIAASLMNTLLGVGSYGRLYKNIREDKGYTYEAYSTLSTDEEVGYFNAGASVRNEVTDSAITEFLYELNRIRDEKVTEEELLFNQNFRTGVFAIQLERPQTVANFALNTARYNLPKDYYATYLEKLNALTVDDIQAVARKYIHPDHAHILVVGNKSEVADKLTRFDSDGTITFRDFYGNEVEAGAALPANMDAQQVLDKYIEAIGGEEHLEKVNDVVTTMTTTLQGMAMEMTIKQKSPGKLSTTVMINGMPMQQQIFDGEKGVNIVQGQRSAVDEAGLRQFRRQSTLFPEMKYDQLGYKAKLAGIEKVNGEDAYDIEITFPNGETVHDYYDMNTGLKVKTIAVQKANGQTVTITNEYKDYQEVDGIKFPHSLNTSGALPFPLTLKVKSIEINKGIDDEVFKVN